MGADLKKRMADLAKLVQATPGWDVTWTSKGHYKFTAPNGRCAFGPFTPSDWHSERKVRRKLRALGFEFRSA